MREEEAFYGACTTSATFDLPLFFGSSFLGFYRYFSQVLTVRVRVFKNKLTGGLFFGYPTNH